MLSRSDHRFPIRRQIGFKIQRAVRALQLQSRLPCFIGRLPPELLSQVVWMAYLDGGVAAISSLCLVSKSFHVEANPLRFRLVALAGDKQLTSFLRLLRRHPHIPKQIRTLSISDSSGEHGQDPESEPVYEDFFYLTAMHTLLPLLAPYLVNLVVVIQTTMVTKYAFRALFETPLPQLRRLTIRGNFSLYNLPDLVARNTISMPALTNLHISTTVPLEERVLEMIGFVSRQATSLDALMLSGAVHREKGFTSEGFREALRTVESGRVPTNISTLLPPTVHYVALQHFDAASSWRTSWTVTSPNSTSRDKPLLPQSFHFTKQGMGWISAAPLPTNAEWRRYALMQEFAKGNLAFGSMSLDEATFHPEYPLLAYAFLHNEFDG